MANFSIRVKLNDQQLEGARQFIKSLPKTRILAETASGKLLDITDDPEFADIIQDIKNNPKYKGWFI